MRQCLLFCVLCLMAPIGYSQLQGPAGPKGDKGDSGPRGLRGYPGPPGAPGFPGQKGDQGVGIPGMKGERGDLGPPGPRGAPGVQGKKGDMGVAGPVGEQGEHGFSGPAGPAGPRGLAGPAGPRGLAGPAGPAGNRGPPGSVVMCGRDPLGSTKRDIDTVKRSTAKLQLAINYDFVRRVGQKYFVSYKERGSFSRAVEFCSQRDLDLALPQNEEENNILTQFFGNDYKTAWINVNNNKAEGNFEADMKKRPLTFTKWGDGQPDRSIQDTGCTMLSENGIWEVTSKCLLDAYIICQI